MIIWLASYPKSGNTWLRGLISTYMSQNLENPFENMKSIQRFPNLIQFKDIINIDILKKNKTEICKHWITAQERINLNGEITFLKTHNFGGAINENQFSNNKNTLGVIYLVRDPRSVAVSLAYHNNITYDKSIKNLLDSNMSSVNSDFITEFRTSWKIHYLSWIKTTIPTILVKYEDLNLDTFNCFKKILDFLKNFNQFNKVEINEEKIKKSIDICKFEKLSNLEKSEGFSEKVNGSFFRSGKVDEWKVKLTKIQINLIKKSFYNEMQSLNYL